MSDVMKEAMDHLTRQAAGLPPKQPKQPPRPLTEKEVKKVAAFGIEEGDKVWEDATREGPWPVVKVGIDPESRIPSATVHTSQNSRWGKETFRTIPLAALTKEPPSSPPRLGQDWWIVRNTWLLVILIVLTVLALAASGLDIYLRLAQ